MPNMQDPATTTVAVGSLTSPWWLPYIESVSQGAATVIPIFALTWLAVQIVRAFWTWPSRGG